MRFSSGFVVPLLVASNLLAQQESGGTRVVRGQVEREDGTLPVGLTVTLRGLNDHEPQVSVPVMMNGSFEYLALEPGEYEVGITNERGQLIDQEFVHVGPHTRSLILRLHPAEPTLSRPASGTISSAGRVSARELLHPVPSKAAKEFRASQKAFKAGDIPKSIEHLQKAIRIHPDFMEAHNNLGVRFMALNQIDRAAAEFQKTVALDPTSVPEQLNLSLVLNLLRRYREAEAAARRALQWAPDSVRAHYVLGQVLAAQEKNLPEALAHLREAVEQFPNARLFLARVLVGQGALNEASAELREYLKSPQAEKRQLAETWLARLSEAAPETLAEH